MGGQWARRNECVVVQPSSKITYSLWAGDGGDGVSAWLYNYQARSRTSYKRAMGETESVPGCAGIEKDHVLSVGGRWARWSQCLAEHASRKITYPLWVDDGRDGVRVWLCSFQQDHVLPISGRWARRSECLDVQVLRKITYSLWAGDGRDSVSAWMCKYRERSRTP